MAERGQEEGVYSRQLLTRLLRGDTGWAGGGKIDEIISAQIKTSEMKRDLRGRLGNGHDNLCLYALTAALGVLLKRPQCQGVVVPRDVRYRGERDGTNNGHVVLGFVLYSLTAWPRVTVARLEIRLDSDSLFIHQGAGKVQARLIRVIGFQQLCSPPI